MIDPLSLDGISGAALGPTFTFLFGCLKDLLIRRKESGYEAQPTQVEAPKEMAEQIGPLIPDRAVVEDCIDELRQLRGVLSVYDDRPDLLRGNDPKLVEALVILHLRLEEIYHRRLPLRDTGTGKPDIAVIHTEMIDTGGKHTGARFGTFHGSLHMEHKVHGGQADSETIGVDIQEFGRRNRKD